jgi:hypothetical protein
LAAALSVFAALGCGAAGREPRSASTAQSSAASAWEDSRTTSSVIPPGQSLRGDGDADNPSDIDGNGDSDGAAVGGADADNDSPTRASYAFPDRDDRAIFAYGHEASARARRAIADVVKRYYAAGSRGDGRTACSLLLPGFANMVAEAYGGRGGSPYLRGASTCAAVLSKLFAHYREQLDETVTLVRVRVKGSSAQVVLSSRSMPASSISLVLHAGSWRIERLIGQPLA